MTTPPVMTLTDELLAEIEAEYGYQRRAMVSLRYEHLGAMLEELRQLRAECQALRVDAERYRWLRDQEAERGISVVHITGWERAATCWATTFPDAELLDTSIDAAMQAQK